MIALLAAVPEETSLIRQSLQNAEELLVNGITLTNGNIHGHAVCLAHSGIGKAAAAATTITLLNHYQAEELWLFGCGGAYPGSGLTNGDLALADSEFFGDEGVETRAGFRDLAYMKLPMRQTSEQYFNTWPTDQRLHDWAQPILEERAKLSGISLGEGPFVTVSTCTGTTAKALDLQKRTGGLCENMEGAAVALACQQLSVPMLELRGISNQVEDRDFSRWNLAAGMTAAQEAILELIQAWNRP